MHSKADLTFLGSTFACASLVLIFITLSGSLLLNSSSAAAADGEKQLIKDLFEDYKPMARPRRNPKQTVDITIDYVMNAIKAMVSIAHKNIDSISVCRLTASVPIAHNCCCCSLLVPVQNRINDL